MMSVEMENVLVMLAGTFPDSSLNRALKNPLQRFIVSDEIMIQTTPAVSQEQKPSGSGAGSEGRV